MFMVAGDGRGIYRGRGWKAGKGQAVVMDLHQAHGYWSNDRNPWEMYWVIFDGPGVARLFQALLKMAGAPVMPFASHARMCSDFSGIFRLLKRHHIRDEAWIWHHLTGLIANIVEGLRNSGWEEGMEGHSEQLPEGIAGAVNLLQREQGRTIALAELAAAAHMSLFHFTRRFREATGFTPMEYLEKLRIHRAQDLLISHPQMRLNEIARVVGYDDPAYFSRVFRKCSGTSPRLYRMNRCTL